MRLTLLAVLLLALPSAAFAQNTPIGSWTTIDDQTGKPKSVIEIYRTQDGGVAGRVAKVLHSEKGPNPVCERCPGERRNQPIEGMVVLWDLKRAGDTWEGGQILDPASGRVYSAKLRPIDGGARLEVRGFKGFSLLGRTQVWARR